MSSKICIGLIAGLLAAALAGCNSSPQAKEAKYLELGKARLAAKDYPRALLEFRNASKVMPKDAEPQYQMGLASLGTQDLTGAARAFRKAAELDPNHTEAQLKLAEMMVNTRNPKLVGDAAKRLETILQNAPDNREASGTLAIAEWKLGQPEDATKRLEETLQKSPADLKSSVTLAKMKLTQRDLAGAEEVLRKAAANAPKSPYAALALGQLLWMDKEPAKAEAEMKRALQLDPKNGAALQSLAALQASGNRLQEAEQTYERLSARPEKEYKHLHAVFLFQTGKRDAALAELTKLAKEDPKDRTARSRLLSAYVTMGKMAEAQRLLADALKDNPKDTDALFQRAELALRNGDAAAAQADLNQVVHFRADSAQAHLALGEVYRAQGSLQARQEYSEALRLNPGMLPARLALTRSFIAANDSKAALQLLDATPESQKNTLGVVTERNWALFATGDFKQMRSVLDGALQSGKHRELLIQDAVLKLRQGDYAGARATADEILRRDPEETRAAQLVVDSYLAQHESRKALERLTELAAGHPKSAPLQDILGRYQLANDRLPEARRAFEAAKAADPKFLPAALELAEIDRREKRWDSARQNLATVLVAEPRNARALVMLGDVELMNGNRVEAIAKYRVAVEIEGNHVAGLNNLAYLLALENPDEALKYAERAAALAPDSANVQDTLGWVYYRKGIYRTAADYLNRAVAKDPTPRRQFHLGMAYLKSGEQELGRKTVLRALEKDPNLAKSEQGW